MTATLPGKHGGISRQPLCDPSLRERFNAKWRLEPETGCHLWTAASNAGGYGLIRITDEHGRRMEVASRTSWRLHIGPIPDGLYVLHHCDTPPCVNPDCLFLGDQADNAADRDAKGRHRSGRLLGEDHGSAKITEAVALEVLAFRDQGERPTQEAIARDLGVSRQLVSAIWRGELWRHLQER